MKPSDIIWVQKLAQASINGFSKKQIPLQEIHQSIHFFLDELSTLMTEFCAYFNDLVMRENPAAVCNVFRIGTPRQGVMILRDKDKLVVGHEGARIRCRVVQVHAYKERLVASFEFEAALTPDNDLVWMCMFDNQKVTPELVVKLYLGTFLTWGCAGFERGKALEDPPQNNRPSYT